MKTYLKLNDINCYRRAFNLSNYVWQQISTWPYFEKQTLGIQLVRAVDSISANLAEGFGRYGRRDKIKFYRYAMGSQKEALDWNEKAKTRELFTQEPYSYILQELLALPQEINQFIKFTNTKLKE